MTRLAIDNQHLRDLLTARRAPSPAGWVQAAEQDQEVEWMLDAPLGHPEQARSLLRAITGLYGQPDQELWTAAVQSDLVARHPRLGCRVRAAGRRLHLDV